ncbi:MAG: polysaccharide lyase family 8 super-sandwich domain-containing protein [Adhaeribacter sp.]
MNYKSVYLLSFYCSVYLLPFGAVAHNGLEALKTKTENIKPQENANADLEKIRTRIISDLLEPAVNEAQIAQLIKSIKPDGSCPNINYQDVSRTGFQHSEHLQNMLDMGRALKKPGSKFQSNPELKKAVSAALDFWLKHDFICDNWWWNEMGTPSHMINILLVLDTDLTPAQREKGLKIANRASLEAFGARPGGDLIQIAAMLGKQGLFARDEQVVEKVVRVMADEIKVTTGRGLKPDLSFHHRTDNVISTLTYGTGYASSFAYWAVKIAGTKYTLPESAMKLLVDYFLDGICQSMVYGRYPDLGAKNRDLSRKDILSPAGAELAKNLLLASNYRREELAEMVKIRQGEIKPNLARTHFFWHSEYFTHQKPNYFASVRMHSSRGNNMEEPHNEEGLKNHHFADGSNFVSRTGQEYFNIFPVWDWQKIPGTTVVQKPALPHWKQIAKKGKSDFVGGVTDGNLGAAAMDLTSVHDPLKARKAWFFFQDEYVCLGAGINAEADYPVATTLNQSLLNEQVVIKRDTKEETLPPGEHTLNKVSWVAHDNIAYIFQTPTALHLKNNTATGNWREINHHTWATTEEVKKDVFKAWLDHGTKPQNAGYAYIVVPNLEAAQVEAYRKKALIEILANTPELQAVNNKEANVSQVVFYQPGKIKITKNLLLTAQSPCMVMLQTDKNGIQKLTVSDPSRKLQTLQLNITSRFEGTGDNWQATWQGKKEGTAIQVKLPTGGMAGQSVILEAKNK